MLSFALAAPNSEAGFEQMSCSLQGAIDAVAFERACQHVVDRHPILRTSFFWEQLKEPLQVVRRRVNLPFEFHDWRNVPAGKREEQIKSFLDQDRLRGFDFTHAPVMRVALVRLTEDTHVVVWSHHHVLMDGWGVAGLVNEVFSAYEVLRHGGDIEPEPSHSYRGYIEWLQQQDISKAENFWRNALQGFTQTDSSSGSDRQRWLNREIRRSSHHDLRGSHVSIASSDTRASNHAQHDRAGMLGVVVGSIQRRERRCFWSNSFGSPRGSSGNRIDAGPLH